MNLWTSKSVVCQCENQRRWLSLYHLCGMSILVDPNQDSMTPLVLISSSSKLNEQQFVLNLVSNLKDRFSHDKAQKCQTIIMTFCMKCYKTPQETGFLSILNPFYLLSISKIVSIFSLGRVPDSWSQSRSFQSHKGAQCCVREQDTSSWFL